MIPCAGYAPKVYHLYTVDIIVSGLPCVDFNTLEFDAPDDDGRRKLKYVHAWNWLRSALPAG